MQLQRPHPLPRRALLALIRRQPDSEYPLELVERLDRDDRQQLLELLREHELCGWAHALLRRAGVEVPADLAQPLAQAHLSTTAHSILLLSAYDRVSKELSAAGIEHIPLKGVHFLRTLYAADPGVRSMGDIDHHHHYRLTSPAPVVVELHWRLSSSFGLTTSPSSLWSGAAPSPIEGASSCERALDQATLLHWLLVHVANHRYSVSLKWLVDLRLLLERQPELLPATLGQASGTVGACAYALALVDSVTGAPVARQGLDLLRPRLGLLRRLLFQQLAQPEVFFERGDFLRKKWPAYGVKLMLADGPKDRLRLAANVTSFKAHLEGLIR